MPRLFVDCDDTLVLWDTPDLGLTTHYDLNLELIGDVECFILHHPEYELVVWSGGGVDYATRWAERCFPHRHAKLDDCVDYLVLPKDMRTPEDQDICIDDMYGELSPRDKRVRVLPPDGLSRCPLCVS